MTFFVELTERAARDLEHIFIRIEAENSKQAQIWFNGLERAILALGRYPARHPATPEDETLRHALYGRKPNVYRVIYAIDEASSIVTILHVRHGARDAQTPGNS